MFQRQKNWISDVLWKPKKAHSLEQLRYIFKPVRSGFDLT